MTVIVKPSILSNDNRCAGRKDREMVCSGCATRFVLSESSWKSAEAKRCPRCGSSETTPMLAEYRNAEPF